MTNIETQTLQQKLTAFDAESTANPKTAEELADDELCDQLARAVLNQRSV